MHPQTFVCKGCFLWFPNPQMQEFQGAPSAIQICKAEFSFSRAKKILNYHPFYTNSLEEQSTVLQRKAQKCQFFLRVVPTVLFFPRRVSIVLLSSQPTHQKPTGSRSNPPKKGISHRNSQVYSPFAARIKLRYPQPPKSIKTRRED